MNGSHSLFRTAALLAGLAVPVVAQTTFAINPRAAYYRTNSDSPAPPLMISLATVGALPGQWLLLQTAGGFSFGTTPDGQRSLAAVFSANNTVLSSSSPHRVPGAIAAGPSFASGNTYFGGLPTDIPEDFYVSRELYADYVRVEVPAGAAWLIVGVSDSYFADNSDPNNDYAITVTPIATPSLPGTGENLELRSGVTAAPTLLPDVKLAPGGSTMSVELRDPLGFCLNNIYVLLGDTMNTGGPVPTLLPRLWVDDLILLRAGIVPAAPGFLDTWSLQAPPGLLGVTLIVQGGALNAVARNGLFETTAAHRFDLQ